MINIFKNWNKTPFSGHFWPFLTKIVPMRIFLEKQSPISVCFQKILYSCKEPEKTNCDKTEEAEETQGQTDWADFIGPLCFTLVQIWTGLNNKKKETYCC